MHLQGATGNQLFCLFAGIAYEGISGNETIFDESYLQPIEIRHPGGLKDFDLYFNGKKYLLKSDEVRLSKRRKYFDRIVFKISSKSIQALNIPTQHRSKVFGFDRDFDLMKRYRKILGFFQTFVYPDLAQELLGKLELVARNPSDWFSDRSIEISGNKKSVALHIRRGDYIQNMDGIGMLSLEYFYSAIRRLSDETDIQTAYVFSDETIDLSGFKKRFPDIDFEIVDAPIDSAPIESILLMSYASYRVISNSSFSWWSAYLSSDQHSNFAPYPWFRNKSNPELLIPNAWNKLDAIWVERDLI